MHFTSNTLISALVAPAVLASPITSISSSFAVQRRKTPEANTGKAVYLISNNVENAVAAVLVNPDGTLGHASVTATGGCGASSLNAMGQPAMPDSLVSQSALTIAGMVRLLVSRYYRFLTISRTFLQ